MNDFRGPPVKTPNDTCRTACTSKTLPKPHHIQTTSQLHTFAPHIELKPATNGAAATAVTPTRLRLVHVIDHYDHLPAQTALPPEQPLDLRKDCEQPLGTLVAIADIASHQPLLHAAVFLVQMAAVSLLARKYNSYYAQRPGRTPHTRSRALY
jgi:hypothetical protein